MCFKLLVFFVTFFLQVELLPELINRVLMQHQQPTTTTTTNVKDTTTSSSTDRSNDRRNFLHPESAAVLPNTAVSPLLSHSHSVPTTSAYHWPASPILPPVSSRTPHLVPEPLHPNS